MEEDSVWRHHRSQHEKTVWNKFTRNSRNGFEKLATKSENLQISLLFKRTRCHQILRFADWKNLGRFEHILKFSFSSRRSVKFPIEVLGILTKSNEQIVRHRRRTDFTIWCGYDFQNRIVREWRHVETSNLQIRNQHQISRLKPKINFEKVQF